MADRNKLETDYENALFGLLMADAAAQEGEQALEQNKQLQDHPDAAIPRETDQRMENAIRKSYAKPGHKVLKKPGKRATLFLCIGALALITLLLWWKDNRPADRTHVSGDPYTPYTETIDGLTYYYQIGLEWWPEGFQVDKENSRTGLLVLYGSEPGQDINIYYCPYNESTLYDFDSEDCTHKTVTIQGHPAEYYEKTAEGLAILNEYAPPFFSYWSSPQLLWLDEENHFIVHIFCDNITEETLMKIANGLRWNGENPFQ